MALWILPYETLLQHNKEYHEVCLVWSFLERYTNIGKKRRNLLKECTVWGSKHSANKTTKNSMWGWDHKWSTSVLCRFLHCFGFTQKSCNRPKGKAISVEEVAKQARTLESVVTREQAMSKQTRRAVRLQAGKALGTGSSENERESRTFKKVLPQRVYRAERDTQEHVQRKEEAEKTKAWRGFIQTKESTGRICF